MKWLKLECVVRQLAEWSIAEPSDPNATVRTFHELWLRAFDENHTTKQSRSSVDTPDAGRRTGRPEPVPCPLATRAARFSAVTRHHDPDPAESLQTTAGSVGPLICNLPERNRRFSGRRQQLSTLEALIAADRGTVVVVHGPGGVGKTQLALEFAHRHRASYSLIWWVPAAEPTDLRRSFRDLADRLRLRLGPDLSRVVQAVVATARGDRWTLAARLRQRRRPRGRRGCPPRGRRRHAGHDTEPGSRPWASRSGGHRLHAVREHRVPSARGHRRDAGRSRAAGDPTGRLAAGAGAGRHDARRHRDALVALHRAVRRSRATAAAARTPIRLPSGPDSVSGPDTSSA